MKRLIVVPVCVLLPACATTSEPVACAGHVVVPAKAFYSSMDRFDPSDDEIARCEKVLARRLSRSGHNLRAYCIRFEGMITDGRRRIVGKAGLKGSGGESLITHADSGEIHLDVFGGGEAFFHFAYDCEKKALAEFEFNATL